MKIIDFHCHLAPPEWRETRPLPPALVDIDGFFAAKEAAGIDFSVLDNAMVNMPGAQFDNLSLDQIQAWNDFAYRLVAANSNRLAALVGINPFGGPEMLKELESAVRAGGFKGVTINSSVDGEYLDSPRAQDFWALVSQLDVPVFVHSPSSPAGGDHLSSFFVVEYVARSIDVALGMASAIFAGVLERYPNLRIVCGTGGGGLAMFPGRLDVAYHEAMTRLQGRPGGPPGGRPGGPPPGMGPGGPPPGRGPGGPPGMGPGGPGGMGAGRPGGPPPGMGPGGPPPGMGPGGPGGRPGGPPGAGPGGMMMTPPRITQPPSRYVRQLYVDTCSYDLPALLCNLQVFGADHMVFGTDFPPVNVPAALTVDLVRSLPISDEDKEKIFWTNAATLLKLE